MKKGADKSMSPNFPVPATGAFFRLFPGIFSSHFKNILEKNINKMYHMHILLRAIRPHVFGGCELQLHPPFFCIKKGL
jgi:hypothetical protein